MGKIKVFVETPIKVELEGAGEKVKAAIPQIFHRAYFINTTTGNIKAYVEPANAESPAEGRATIDLPPGGSFGVGDTGNIQRTANAVFLEGSSGESITMMLVQEKLVDNVTGV